ncbi:MAG: PQQ-binding-like beta-propeller repeat protein [Anaerolineae bacterium]|nr:PQQ-binding-like beta-propeller repeat protein [Anaerolineae bacterium]
MTAGYENMDWAQLGPANLDIAHVKQIHRDTPPLDGSAGAATIVSPDDPAYLHLARELQAAIQGAQPGPVRVKPPDAVDAQDKRQSIIALGNIANNRLLGELYHAYHVALDHAYPGRGGHVLQTVVDPWGYGSNVIACGGSTMDGVRAAVQQAARSVVRQDGKVWFPALHEIQIGADFQARYPGISFACTPEHRAWMIAHAYERLEQGMHRGATPTVSHAGLMYHLTGDERFAELYRDLFKILYQAAVNDPGTGPWSPWGFDADFQSATMLQAWNVVEAAPAFSERDRLYITNHLLSYVRYMAQHARQHRPTKPRTPRHNHYTFAALGLLYGAQYFAKVYHHPEADEWLALADECFQTQAQAFKANEDCNSYQWLTFYHTLKYAFVRPDPAFLDNGNARMCLDLGIATMDNLGYQVPYGDVASYAGTFSEIPYFNAAAWALDDPAYQPVLATKERLAPAHDIDGIQPVGYQYQVYLGEGRARAPFSGVSRLPVEPIYYEHFAGPIAYEDAFDKIVFRHSLDPMDDYVLLDGLSNGGHLHYDGNAIVRYTSKGRIWLADADYLKSPQKFHNTVMVFREGRGTLIPPYAEFGQAAWLEPFGYARSTVSAYCGADWTRHILELRGDGFVVLDQIVAREAGAYDFRCLWRSVGDASLDQQARTFTVEQGGPRMELICAPGFSAPAELALKHEPMIRADWDQYPYHGRSADVKVLQERASIQLAAGARYAYWNLFGTNPPYPRLTRLAEELVRLEGDAPALIGAGGALSAWTDAIETDAAFVYAAPDQVFLADVTTLTLGGRTIRSDVPLVMRLDLAAGQAIVSADQPASLQVLDAEHSLASGTQSLSLPWLGEARAVVAQALSAPSPGPTPAQRMRQAERARARTFAQPTWALELPGAHTPYSACLGAASPEGTSALYVGTVEGALFCVEEGRVAWQFQAGGRINSVAVDDVDGDGQPEVVIGSADHSAYLLDASGRERWRQTLPPYLHEPFARVVTTADLGLEEGRAVIVGGKNCHVHAFTPAGVELWRHEVIHGVKDLAPVDMTGDGRDEILAVTDWSTYQCIDATGKGLWPVWSVHSRYGRGTNVVRGADIDGDGAPEMICGAIDSCVYAFTRGGDLLWEFFTGEEISALAFLDLDGDGVPETIAGAMNGYVYALDARGREIWRRGVGEEVNSLAILPEAGPAIAVGADGPLVALLDARGQVRSTLDSGSPVRKLLARATPAGAALYLIHREGRVARIDYCSMS